MTRVIETSITNLNNLPAEIILCICDFLLPASIVSIASLALSNRRFLKILQTHVPSLKDKDRNPLKPTPFRLGDRYRIDFLRLMDTKLPHLHFCFDCRGLHPWKEIKVPGPVFEDSTTGPNESCIRYNPQSISQERGRPLNLLPLPYPTRYTFRLAHLQLVMRQFNHGPGFGFKPEDLRYTEVQLREIWGVDIPFLMSVEAKIAQIPEGQPSLCLRVQHLISAPRCWVWNSYMCSHIRYHGYPPPIYTGFAMCQTWTEVCALCRTTYRFRSVDYIQHPKHLIKLTKWTELGTGTFIEGLDASTEPSLPKRPDMSYQLFEQPLASDSVPEIFVAQLSYMNESLLEDKRYAEVMEKVRPRYWVLQGDDKHRFSSG